MRELSQTETKAVCGGSAEPWAQYFPWVFGANSGGMMGEAAVMGGGQAGPFGPVPFSGGDIATGLLNEFFEGAERYGAEIVDASGNVALVAGGVALIPGGQPIGAAMAGSAGVTALIGGTLYVVGSIGDGILDRFFDY